MIVARKKRNKIRLPFEKGFFLKKARAMRSGALGSPFAFAKHPSSGEGEGGRAGPTRRFCLSPAFQTRLPVALPPVREAERAAALPSVGRGEGEGGGDRRTRTRRPGGRAPC